MAEVNEKVQNHADEDFAKLLEEYDNQKSHDEVVTGKVIAVKDNEIFVDVGRKLEGVLDVSEVSDAQGNLCVKVGDDIKVAIIGSRGGRPVVSYRKAIKKEKVKAFIDSYDENAENVYDVKIVSFNKGGYVCVSEDDVEFFVEFLCVPVGHEYNAHCRLDVVAF